MSAADAPRTVRVVRGAPRQEELAALVLVLHALAARPPGPDPAGQVPAGPAPWPRPATVLAAPTPAWSARGTPAWRDRATV
ncbi:acyl-CoA carboxylase epsilon subunit [Streptomyces sp. NPDC004726]